MHKHSAILVGDMQRKRLCTLFTPYRHVIQFIHIQYDNRTFHSNSMNYSLFIVKKMSTFVTGKCEKRLWRSCFLFPRENIFDKYCNSHIEEG